MTLNVFRATLKLLAATLGADVEISREDKEAIRANLDGIYVYSKRNDMAHLVGHALVSHGLMGEDDKLFPLFEKEQLVAMFRREGQDFELSRICKTLEEAGIDFLPLKGSIMRRFYPEPWMRTSCDIDVLVKKEDFAKAKRCMLEILKYKQSRVSSHDESFDAPGRVHIELHFDLLEEDRAERSEEIMREVWEHVKPIDDKKHHMEMTDELFYFYHIAHIAKHFEDGGIGVRAFLDLYLLLLDHSNDEKRSELLERGGLSKFERVARDLALCWFAEGDLDILGQRAEVFVLRCGTYGAIENSILLAKEKTGGKRGYLLSRIFMPYDSIKYAFPILIKHKWLMPFCQIARWFKLISPKEAKRAARQVKASNTLSDRDLRRMKNLMRDVGLK